MKEVSILAKRMAIEPQNLNDDLVLVNLMKQGNELAFQKIYNSYWEKLFAYTFNRLHIRAASKEVVQDVFLSMWEKRDVIVINSSLSAYLYAATKHRLLNELRSIKLRKAYASDYVLFVKHLHDNSNIEHQYLIDLHDSLEAAICKLPKQCQIVFRLSRQEHIPNRNIAERLNISVKTVDNYLTQALKCLRASLSEFLVLLILMAL